MFRIPQDNLLTRHVSKEVAAAEDWIRRYVLPRSSLVPVSRPRREQCKKIDFF